MNSEFEKAIQEYNKVISINPLSAEAYYYRGEVYLITDPNIAVSDFTKAIHLKPNYA